MSADATSCKFLPSRSATKSTDCSPRYPVIASLLPSCDQVGVDRKLHSAPQEIFATTIPSLVMTSISELRFLETAIVNGGIPAPPAPVGMGIMRMVDAVAPVACAVMIASPGPTAVTSPDVETLATETLEVVHEIGRSGRTLKLVSA